MKLACGLCWDRNCTCTQKELDEYKQNKKVYSKTDLVPTITKPCVYEGDVVVKENLSYFVKSVTTDGVGYISPISNNGECFRESVLTEPYLKIVKSK